MDGTIVVTTPKKRASKANGKKKQRRVVKTQAEEHDAQYARRIIKAHDKVQHAEEHLAAVRREWNDRVAEERVGFAGKAEADTAETFKGDYRKHLQVLQEGWQNLQETEAGRKMHLHEALEGRRAARDKLREVVENSRQLVMPGIG